MKPPSTVQDLYNAVGKRLAFHWLTEENGAQIPLKGHFPGADQQGLVGTLNCIHPNRIQIIGHAETVYLTDMEEISYRETLDKLFSNNPAAIVFSDDIRPTDDLLERAKASGTPLLSSPLPDTQLVSNLHYYLSSALAERITLHGVFIEVMGSGILLTGPSSVGKSELALALISRGHRLIADDAPEFAQVAPDILTGQCPPLLQDLLEVRGLGILNIRAMYGEGAVRRKKNLHLVIELKEMDDEALARMDRLRGARSERNILGVTIPQITIPVAQGRNLAILVEAATQNHALRLKGYDASEDFSARQQELINAGHNE